MTPGYRRPPAQQPHLAAGAADSGCGGASHAPPRCCSCCSSCGWLEDGPCTTCTSTPLSSGQHHQKPSAADVRPRCLRNSPPGRIYARIRAFEATSSAMLSGRADAHAKRQYAKLPATCAQDRAGVHGRASHTTVARGAGAVPRPAGAARGVRAAHPPAPRRAR